MLRATLNEPVPLQVLVPDGLAGLFIRVRVVGSNGTVLTTLPLVHQLDGLYAVNWTPIQEGYHTALYDFYTDADYTVSAGYDRAAEQIEVSSDKTNIIRLLGLERDNAVLDEIVYNTQGRMTSGRVRAYNSAANAQAAGATGLLFVWRISSSYNTAQQLTSYSLVRE